MSLSRVSPTEWASACAGAALLVALFLPWYGDSSGFTALSAVVGPILALIAVSALALPLLCASQRKSDIPIVYETWLTMAAVLGVILVVVRAVAPPEGGAGAGLYVALVGSVALACCSWRAMVRGD